MESRPNLTRFTYEKTAFQGWRLNIRRGGTSFIKYFSDKKYGGAEEALREAERALYELKCLLRKGPYTREGKLWQSTIRSVKRLLKWY